MKIDNRNIYLNGDEVATAIFAYLVAHDVHIVGPRTVRLNDGLIKNCRVYIDPSGDIIANGERITERGMIETICIYCPNCGNDVDIAIDELDMLHTGCYVQCPKCDKNIVFELSSKLHTDHELEKMMDEILEQETPVLHKIIKGI